MNDEVSVDNSSNRKRGVGAVVVEEEETLSPSSRRQVLEQRKEDTKATTTLEENLENLRFEDPFEDEYDEEVVVETNDDDDDDDYEDVDDNNTNSNNNNDNNDNTSNNVKTKVWTPFDEENALKEDEELDRDDSAYTLYHGLTAEWPCLSFCFVRDGLGDCRNRFPHSFVCAVGTQADAYASRKNKVTLMKLSDLTRTSSMKKKHNDNDSDNSDDDSDSSDESESDKEEECDKDPIMEHFSIPHVGGVNRIRSMPQLPHVISTWSDTGRVCLYDTRPILDTFDRSSNNSNNQNHHSSIHQPHPKKSFFTYQGHTTEGYAMDWSIVDTGRLATGDCHGSIHLWNPDEISKTTSTSTSTSSAATQLTTSAFSVTPHLYTSSHSVEDIAFSPTESTVLAAAHCGGDVCIYDTRRAGKPMLTHNANQTNQNSQSNSNNNVDVNVLSWNAAVANLLATGSDDGTFAVWDLRQFGTNSSSSSITTPLAKFTQHRTPITSVEWHPTDESTVVVTDDHGAYVYDLSVEAEYVNDHDDVELPTNLPPQILFVHAGSTLVKECHWHPQIQSLLMTTALDGFSVFIPSNL